MGLIDRLLFRKPAEAPKASAEAMTDVAWSNSTIYSGKDFPKYNPDDLVGRKGVLIYKRMMVDEQIKAVVRFKRDAITSRAWMFECEYEELSEEERELRCKLFDDAICRMEGSFTDALNNILSAMYMGFSLTEKVYKLNEVAGKQWYGVKHLRLKPQESFLFYQDAFGNLTALKQQTFGDEQELDPTKFIHYVQNPEWDANYGRSELRECYRSWFSKDIILKFQNIHMERFAGGFIWAKPSQGKTISSASAEYANLQDVLTNIHTKTSIIVPGNIDLNVVQGATTDIYERAIAQHDKSIAKSLLVPNLMGISEQGNTGSFAQSETQLEAFLWTLEADTARLEDVLNEQLFKDIGDLNFGDGLYPTFSFAPISNKAKMSLINAWKDLVAAGAVEATDTDEAHLRELMEMPEKGEVLAKSAPALPEAGAPQNQAQSDDAEDAGAQAPDDEKKPLEETIIGKQNISISAFSRAMKRVDFAVIANKADNSTQDAVHEIADINSAAVARLVALAGELKLGTADGNPNDVQKIQYTASEMSALKGAVNKGLKDAWAIGESHAKRELQKAKGADFAVNDLALQDLAAAYLKQKSYSLAGDISAASQKTIRNLLMEGVKVSKTADETTRAIYKALEADGMLTEEAVVEALGAGTVKNASARIETAIRTTSFEAINEARYSFFSDPALNGFVEALEYSAILDDRTTEICSQLNGETYGIDDAVWSTFRPPNHFNCRSLLIPVTIRDTWMQSDEPIVMPQKGFGFSKATCQHEHAQFDKNQDMKAMLAGQQGMTDAITALANRPAQPIDIKLGDVNVHLPDGMVNLEATIVQPDVNITTPTPNVIVNVAPADATIINDVHPAKVELTLPDRKTITTVNRDKQGNIISTHQFETNKG